ncbi:MAG: hypothetical protein M1837_000987 [Sclerophora amabilis]|nr:MAG: hypothetical protein M1837_000987 [Sclerophora amabilis]
MTGSVSPLYAPATVLGRAGVVFGHDLTSEAALTKLSYLLALPGLSMEDIKQRMAISIRGELNEQSRTLFQHPDGQLSQKLASLTSLGYAITKGNHEVVKEIMRGEAEWLLNEADYSGNTPLLEEATGPNVEILRDFLLQGASVHLRNRNGRTPLFLAANAGLMQNVLLLRESGAHLHPEEIGRARLQSSENSHIWHATGLQRRDEGSPPPTNGALTE